MEENTLQTNQPQFRLFNDRAIYVGTFLGGPLVAGYLIAENFKRLEAPAEKIKKTWLISAFVTFLLLCIVFLVPGIDKIPRIVLPLAYSVTTQYLVKHYQGNDIKAHIESEGQLYSVWRATWIGLIGAVVFIVLLFLFVITLSLLGIHNNASV